MKNRMPKPKRKAKRSYQTIPPRVIAMRNGLSCSFDGAEVTNLLLALQDLLRFYDILSGHVGELGVGWTYADIKRLEEIRDLVIRGS